MAGVLLSGFTKFCAACLGKDGEGHDCKAAVAHEAPVVKPPCSQSASKIPCCLDLAEGDMWESEEDQG